MCVSLDKGGINAAKSSRPSSSRLVRSLFEKQPQRHLLKVQEVMLHQQQKTQLALQRLQGSVLMA
jgi:hypothetical protein